MDGRMVKRQRKGCDKSQERAIKIMRDWNDVDGEKQIFDYIDKVKDI